MTVEIAIMNLEAVALAADSAATVYTQGNTKIFGSQNKLFPLSTVAPVGILVYGSGTFMSIPWETLIKEYRHRRGTTVFPQLSDYVDDFCGFLTRDVSSYISTEQQAQYAEILVRHVYHEIAYMINQILEATRGQISEHNEANHASQVTALVDRITSDVVEQYSRRARDADLVDNAPEDFLDSIRKSLSRRRKSIRDDVFERPLDRRVARKLNTIAERSIGAMVDDILFGQFPLTTGIVVAGFGQNDLFPSYAEVHVEGLVLGVLKKQSDRIGTTGPKNRAEIVSFAQDDMIYQFMQGIAPVYENYLHGSMISHLSSYTKLLVENLDRYSDIERGALLKEMEAVHPEIADSFVSQVEEIGRDYHANDIVDVVAMLPKEELAEMAEALVSLTSLRMRVSMGEETVGGPIDVALITKGDGLVWIKRKHYFPADLNPAYFARKYGNGGTGHAKEKTEGA